MIHDISIHARFHHFASHQPLCFQRIFAAGTITPPVKCTCHKATQEAKKRRHEHCRCVSNWVRMQYNLHFRNKECVEWGKWGAGWRILLLPWRNQTLYFELWNAWLDVSGVNISEGIGGLESLFFGNTWEIPCVTPWVPNDAPAYSWSFCKPIKTINDNPLALSCQVKKAETESSWT